MPNTNQIYNPGSLPVAAMSGMWHRATDAAKEITTEAKAKNRLLLRSLPIVAAAMGRRNGVKVITDQSAETAMTDGKVIILPTLDPDDPRAADLARGYIDHESAHLSDTDFNVEKNAHPLLGQVMNILEDVRIETLQHLRYPGAKENAQMLTDVLIERDLVFNLNSEDDDSGVILGALYTALQAPHLGNEELAKRADAYYDEFEKRMPGLHSRIMALAMEVADAENTEDVGAITSAIGAAMEQYQEEQQQKANPPPPGDKPGKSGKQPGGVEKAQQQAQQQSQVAAQAVSNALNAKEEDIPNCDIGALAASALGQSHQEAVSNGTAGCGAGSEVPNPAPAGTAHISARAVQRQGAFLRARLQSLIQAQTLAESSISRRGFRIEPRLLHRVAVGDSRIFIQREDQRRIDTALGVLADVSGSMSGKVRLALEAAMVIVQGLEGVQGATAGAWLFPAGNTTNVTTLTAFGETAKASEKRYLIHCDGGTPMSEALWFLAQQLLGRPEPRKIGIVCTDGGPNNRATTADILERLAMAGIEVIGVGIGTTVVESLFKHSCVVNDINELAPALVNVIGRHYVKPL